MPKKIEISHRTIIFTVLFLLSLWFLFLIRSVLLILFISLILMSALNHAVKKLEEHRLPRWLAILVIYVLVLAVIVVAIGGIVPPLIEQTSNLISSTPDFFRQFQVLGIDEKVIASQFSQFASVPTNIIKFLIGVFSNFLNIIGIALITFYLLLERRNLDHYLTTLFGEEREKEIEAVINKIELRLGGWVRGQLFLMTFVGLLNYIGFRIIGISFALPLAILAFLLEIVPNVGPTLAAVPAILIALISSPIQALAVAGWAFLVQQIENTILVPRIMKTIAGVNPLITIISLAVGFKLAGVGGAILAVPSYLVLEVILRQIFGSGEKEATSLSSSRKVKSVKGS